MNRTKMAHRAGSLAIATGLTLGGAVVGAGTASANECYPARPNCSTFQVVRPGGVLQIVGNNWAPETDVNIAVTDQRSTSAPMIVMASADAAGNVAVTLPDDFAPGQYVVTASGVDTNGREITAEQPVEFRAASSASAADEAAEVAAVDGRDDTEILAEAPLGATPTGNGDALVVLGAGAAALAAMRLRSRRTVTD